MIDLVSRALAFATQAHASVGQTRKYTGEPYINHPIEVMGIVKATAHHDDVMLAAALLHDTIEDTPVSYEHVLAAFGTEVADMVMDLTDQCPDGNRAARKAAEALRLGTIPSRAQTVKLADLISNTASIVAHDPGFARIYLREVLRVLEAMTEGDAGLRARALGQIDQARETIGFVP